MQKKRDRAGRWGLAFGGALGLVLIARSMLLSDALGLGAGARLGVDVLYLLALVALPAVAGGLAARESGSIGSGTFAGFIAGLIGGIVNLLSAIILPAIAPALTASTLSSDLGTAQGLSLCGVPVLAVIGSIAGMLGGIAGRLSRPKRTRSAPVTAPVAQNTPGA